ncbi:MAG: glycoside hydrolase [Candidatus Omnitrophica bacterium]|nr:glycoside hydrolase [Candidatus Omnitrophota bacterium]MDD5488465.1 glycoside hydrolase [Candidatus Omnitrophota bacterium]
MAKTKKGSINKLVPAIAAVAVVGAVLISMSLFNKKGTAIEFQKGMGYATWSNGAYLEGSSDNSLTRLGEIGTKWTSILVTWYQTTCWTGDIQRTGQTPSDESMVHAINKAHELGMKVMLKLHLDLLDKTDGSWRGEIGCVREADWDEWFRKYTEYVLYYADMAEKNKVEMLCVGTELSSSATSKGYLWRDLIKAVRSRYSGALTYAAHWDRYQDIRFWDILDYVGINAYFPLTEEMDPSYDTLKEGWAKWVTEMEDFQKSVNKPIIFPEIGCSSADGAAIRPWEHVPRSEVNLKLQERYYKVLLDIFWEKDWFYGMYWWYWGTNVNMGGEYNRNFTPQNKPAETLVKEWYAKPSPR